MESQCRATPGASKQQHGGRARYEYVYQTNTLFKAIFFDTRGRPTNEVTQNVAVETGEFVHLDGSLIAPIWLACLSSNYFAGRTAGECPPVWSVPQEARWKMTIPFRSTKDDLAGLRSIAFMSPREAPMVGPNGEITMLPFPKNVGIFTNAALITSAYTNWQAHEVPQKAALTLVSCDVASEKRVPIFYRVAEFLLTTTRISGADAASLSLPNPKQRVYVSEYRLEGKKPVDYVGSNILSLKDPRLVALARSQEERLPPLAGPRLLFWAASVLGLGGLGYFAWLVQKRAAKDR